MDVEFRLAGQAEDEQMIAFDLVQIDRHFAEANRPDPDAAERDIVHRPLMLAPIEGRQPMRLQHARNLLARFIDVRRLKQAPALAW